MRLGILSTMGTAKETTSEATLRCRSCFATHQQRRFKRQVSKVLFYKGMESLLGHLSLEHQSLFQWEGPAGIFCLSASFLVGVFWLAVGTVGYRSSME